MDVDLTALGLPPLAARVLSCIAEQSWTTSVALAGRLEVSRPQVSRALDLLVERGLVERTRGRRPAPVTLTTQLDEVVAATLEAQEERRQGEARRAHEAAAHLRAAGARRAGRPAPMTHLDPLGPAHDYALRSARTSFDEVCRPDGDTMLWGRALVGRGRPARRILVVGDPPAERWEWMRRRGIPGRTTDARLPALVVVDRCRAQVELSADGRASRTGWTHDAAQVQALLRLFDLWWEEADP